MFLCYLFEIWYENILKIVIFIKELFVVKSYVFGVINIKLKIVIFNYELCNIWIFVNFNGYFECKLNININVKES